MRAEHEEQVSVRVHPRKWDGRTNKEEDGDRRSPSAVTRKEENWVLSSAPLLLLA